MAIGADLYKAAKQQMIYAEAGYALASVQAEVIPPAMLQPATNTEGAYLKSAYWLATAARLAYAAKRNGSTLLSMADDYLSKGDPGVLNRLYGISARVGGQSTDPRVIGEILQGAASAASQMGISNVAATLRGLGSASAIEQRQENTSGSDLTLFERVQNIMSFGLYAKVKPYRAGILVSGVILLLVGGIAAYVYRSTVKSAAVKTAKAGSMFASLLV